MNLFRRSSRSSGSSFNRSGTLTPDFQLQFTVLLTGSTGNFGAYVLDLLLAHPRVRKIICLNRSADAKDRQLAAHHARGLNIHLDPERVVFLQADLSHERLGVPDEAYQSLLDAVDLVIHNAWPVDFNRNFSSFKPHIDGVQHLINFCILGGKRRQPWATPTSTPSPPPERASGTPHVIKFLFVSSIGATSNFGSAAPTSRAKIPEVELTDWKVARTGYGQSKLVSERLLAHSVRKLGVEASIVRVGQLAGPVLHGELGHWPEREWLPSLIRSSFTLGVLPESLGPVDTVDWVPVDLAASVIVELSTALVTGPNGSASPTRRRKPPEASFYHLVNPQTTTWSSLALTIVRYMPPSVELIPFTEWVDLVKQSATEGEGFRGVDEGVNPAAKLIDFFDNLQDRAIRFPKSKAAELDTKQTVQVSPTLAEMRMVGKDWLGLWMRQWKWGVQTEEKL